MTFEQKQELIEALSEGEGGSENIIIDIQELYENNEQNITDEEMEAIFNFKAILKRSYNYYSITYILNEGNGDWITIGTGYEIKSGYFMTIEEDTSRLRLISNSPV